MCPYQYAADKIKIFHESVGFPPHISAQDLYCRLNEHVVVRVCGRVALFMLLSEPLNVEKLKYPLISMLTPLEHPTIDMANSLMETLGSYGKMFLILHENCDFNSKLFLELLPLTSTFYEQVKLLFKMNRLDESIEGIPNGIRIRCFVKGYDEQAYADLYNEILGYLGTSIDREFVCKVVKRKSFDPDGYFLAENSNSLVGFASIENEPFGPKGSGFGYIYQFGVRENFHGTGLADALMSRVKKYAKVRGINRIGVGVRRSNGRALSFFQKNGFSEAYAVKGYILNLENSI
ncbi:GNAT family N-acetyltransferase [Candidatus Parcubacteria bacterium]|nr:MAG: GNAT family N-acetyltransferase [Candidatus Parcubacteria bacterium]